MSLATAATLLGLLVGPGGDAQPDASALAAPLTAEAASPALASGPLPGLGGLLAPFDDEEDEADVDEREGEGDEADEARADRSRPFDRGSRDRGDGRRGPVPGVGRAEDALDICRRGLLGRLLLGPCDDGRNRQEQATPEPPPETPPAEPTSPPTTTPTATPTDAPTPDSTPTGTPTPSSTPSPTPTSPPTGTPTGTPAPGTTSPGTTNPGPPVFAPPPPGGDPPPASGLSTGIWLPSGLGAPAAATPDATPGALTRPATPETGNLDALDGTPAPLAASRPPVGVAPPPAPSVTDAQRGGATSPLPATTPPSIEAATGLPAPLEGDDAAAQGQQAALGPAPGAAGDESASARKEDGGMPLPAPAMAGLALLGGLALFSLAARAAID